MLMIAVVTRPSALGRAGAKADESSAVQGVTERAELRAGGHAVDLNQLLIT